MAKIYKLTKGSQTIYPATTTDAVVNPNSRKNLTAELSELEVEINGYVFKLSDFEIGQWVGTGQSIYPNSTEGYLRFKQALDVDIPTGFVISVIDTNHNQVRLADLGLVVKFTNAEGDHVESGYADSGYQIQVQGTAKYMYIHASTEKINAVSGYSILGLYYKPVID